MVGLTLVVAGDSYVVTLFVVIAFHQMFEGIALGTRIAALGTPRLAYMDFSHGHNHGFMAIPTLSEDELEALHPCQTIDASNVRTVSMRKKILMCAAFALVTPSGMAIGIGVVKVFNGNDPTTLMAMGTLDAFSAGILLWVGIVDMWVCDWGKDGEMARASPSKAAIGISALCTGMAFMSLLGKWA